MKRLISEGNKKKKSQNNKEAQCALTVTLGNNDWALSKKIYWKQL